MIVRILRRLRGLWRQVAAIAFRRIAGYEAWLEGGKLEMAHSVVMGVRVRVDGKGRVFVGDNCSFGYKLAPRFGNGQILLQAREPGALISIGRACSFSNNVSIVARTRVEFGERCLVGDRVTIFDADFHTVDPVKRRMDGGAGETEAVSIGRNCWIGTGAMVLKGVTIGDDSIIAPLSVVTKSFPAGSVVAGVPARIISSFNG